MERAKESFQQPSDEQWQRLFDLSVKFREVAPWQYQTKRPLFGVELPRTGEVAYICTVGFDAHRPGMIAYFGDKGFHCCRDDNNGGWNDALELIFQAPHLKVVYMDRDQLRKEERKLIKSQGLKFRNRFNWPAFRSFMPGYVTWRLNREEADDLAVIMEQTCEMLTENPDIIDQEHKSDTLIPVRRQEIDGTWDTEKMVIPVVPECCKGVKLRRGLIRCLRDLPQTDNQMSLEMFVANEMLHDDEGRPYYPMCLVLTDEVSGMSIHSAVVGGTRDLREIVDSIGKAFIEGIRRNKARPSKLMISSWTLAQILDPALNALDIRMVSEHTAVTDMSLERWSSPTSVAGS